MSRRRAARPLSRAVEYTHPGHVIGGSEPKSWDTAQRIRRAAKLRGVPKPRRTGAPMNAAKASNCPYCGLRVKKGAKIAPAVVDGRNRWLHLACTRSPKRPDRPTPPDQPTPSAPGNQTVEPDRSAQTARDLLDVWTNRWGPLTPEHRDAFLSDGRISQVLEYEPQTYMEAINQHRRLDDILDLLRNVTADGLGKSTSTPSD